MARADSTAVRSLFSIVAARKAACDAAPGSHHATAGSNRRFWSELVEILGEENSLYADDAYLLLHVNTAHANEIAWGGPGFSANDVVVLCQAVMITARLSRRTYQRITAARDAQARITKIAFDYASEHAGQRFNARRAFRGASWSLLLEDFFNEDRSLVRTSGEARALVGRMVRELEACGIDVPDVEPVMVGIAELSVR